jgi:predicted NAD/FAD-dependent oxidoreductase
VSPFRIVREAAAVGGDGTEMFLDDLLVWRELACNFCLFTDNVESLAALPAWASKPLLAYADDPRPMPIVGESLARSQSGDPLWDLAQVSLRTHGKLHNDLRMTWTKAIPNWRPSPQVTLDTLITLNHRYTLDRSDPNSYGGLLWALGLFNRPYPEQPVSGQLRTRSTHAHNKRMVLQRYRERVLAPSCGRHRHVAIIGAGVAGLSAARMLHDHGHTVTVFEKSRGLGGRAATRRYEDIEFDHGAQYFTARDPVFVRAVESWLEQGVITEWHCRIGRVDGDAIEPRHDQPPRYVAQPGMSSLGRYLAKGLEVRRGVRVAEPRFTDDRWRLTDDAARPLGDFDALIVATPAPQTKDLLRPASARLADIAGEVVYDPCWAVMAQFETPQDIGFDGLFFDDGVLSWAANNASKPGRAGFTWVVHGAAAWTRTHIDASADEVAQELAAHLCATLHLDTAALQAVSAHRWLYSLARQPLDVGALWEKDQRLAVCGDWCAGSRIEGAFLSGQAAAGRLLGHLATTPEAVAMPTCAN